MPKVCQIVDCQGHVVERVVNEDGTVPLRHGEALRVPMIMMDSLQRAVAEHGGDANGGAVSSDTRRCHVVEREGDGLLREDRGMRITDDATYVTDASGAQFVLADALGRTDRASLNRDSGGRVLVPVGDRADGAVAVRRMERDAARREMIDSMSNAWRGDPARLETGQRYAQPTFDAAEGARRKQEARDAMVKETTEAWRKGK